MKKWVLNPNSLVPKQPTKCEECKSTEFKLTEDMTKARCTQCGAIYELKEMDSEASLTD